MPDMRSLMNLVEAPLADFHLVGSPDLYPGGGYRETDPGHPLQDRQADLTAFDKGTSFSKADQRALKTDTYRDRVFTAFKKTPHNFEIIVMNGSWIEDSDFANDSVDSQADLRGTGVTSSYDKITGKPGVIRVVLLSNLSPKEAKIPLTPWIIAHKIGHALQDHTINNNPDETTAAINAIVGMLDFEVGDWKQLTMRSAKTKKLENPFEMFAEAVAQYLITGAFVSKGTYEQRAKAAQANKMLKDLFDSLEGKVLSEV